MNRFIISDLKSRNKALILILTVCFLLLTATLLVRAQEAFVGPGGCTSKEECRTYCDEDGHQEECLIFAVENGLMTQEEVDRARQFLNQTGPGGCRGEECKSYCDDPANTEECIRFAEEQGFIKPGEAERLRKMREIAERDGPGGCRGETCRTYCEDESHRDECFVFAREHDLVGEEDIKHYETSLKIREKIEEGEGPGECQSENECRVYCSNPAHLEECVLFGAQHGGMSEDEVRRILEEFRRFKNKGQEFEERARTEFETRREEFESRRQEFENKVRDFSLPADDGVSNFRGPGGCNSEESCREYCMANPESCGYMMRFEDNRGEYREGMMPLPGFMPSQSEEFQPQSIPVEYQEQYEQYQEYQPESFNQNDQTPPEEFRSEPTLQESKLPTGQASYDHSRSFLSNVISAFLAPFRK